MIRSNTMRCSSMPFCGTTWARIIFDSWHLIIRHLISLPSRRVASILSSPSLSSEYPSGSNSDLVCAWPSGVMKK